MKRLIYVELVMLVVLLIVAVLACGNILKPAFSPNSLSGTTAPTTIPTTAPTTEPTTVPTSAPTTIPTTAPTTVPTTAPTVFVPTWNTYPANRKILAKQYFVYDCKNNTFLISSGQSAERIYPASITKLFTAYVAMQYLQPDQKITVGNALDLVAWGSSVAKLKKGDVLTAEQLVEAMMLPSGNDASYVLACEVGRMLRQNPQASVSSAVSAFMSEMNRQAAAAGMTGTNFVNPDGIHDSRHYTTFGDLVILGKLAMANPTVMKYAIKARDQVTLHGETIQWKNTNKLIDPTNSYYCPYAVGLKTGQTPSAGSCLLSAFRMNGAELLIGVFGCPKEDDRFDDTLDLFNRIVLK